MLNLQQFTAYVEPKGKGRPKFIRATGRAYTPKTTVEYERSIRDAYLEERNAHRGWEVFDSAISMTIVFCMPIPKSTSKKKRAAMIGGEIEHTKKPDVDNLCKAVLDALNGVAFTDDALVTSVMAVKKYAEEPRVEVSIWQKGETNE